MTGKNFKLIRRANGITQMQIAEIFGFKSTTPIHNIERRSEVHSKYSNKLKEMLNLQFNNSEEYQRYLIHCQKILKWDT